MYNEEEVADSLAFCKDIKKYYEQNEQNYIYSLPSKHITQTVYDSLPMNIEENIQEKEAKYSVPSVIWREVINVLICVAIAFIASQLITHYVGQHTKVEGSSMENTLHNDDYLIIDKMAYRLRGFSRFDIVVFPFSKDEYYIKRIIGLPTEEIEIIGGSIYINGVLLDESFGKEAMYDGLDEMDKIELGTDEYFVMGDNRNNSFDSRYPEVGLIHKDDIIGRAWIRIYPFDSFGFLSHK